MALGEAARQIIPDQWDASPDCESCDERAAALNEIAQIYDAPHDRTVAAGAIGYCLVGKQPNPALCARECPIGRAKFMQAANSAVARSHQPKVRAPRLSEEE